MSHHWSLISIFISIILFSISYTYSTPIHSDTTNHIINGNTDEYQRAHDTFIYSLKNILDESDSYERIKLLNSLREQLNRMCIVGYFGSSQANECRRVADVMQQTYVNDDEKSDKFNQPHGIQKRFFCNGFIGCKSASG